ncbi:hypothetical protein SY83_13705 [Paenibacillus swuensis]|uniref:Uncharacterized protein n=1 Tax=Paenibacillus swuensis TaxID=1178515 RepID=A0A172TK40_9BACL|nr:hypothetical protein [Paenibacillus swuensis]ANE47143.1 hypothetical protein SY83_13705 [Paenibacillus swuensis]
MRWTVNLINVTLFVFLITGCFNSNQNDKEIMKVQETQETQETQVAVHQTKFSYLEQLSDEKVKLYEQYLADKNISHFKAFSPEEVLLAYIHASVSGDIEVN